MSKLTAKERELSKEAEAARERLRLQHARKHDMDRLRERRFVQFARVDKDGQHRNGMKKARQILTAKAGIANSGRQWRKLRKALRKATG